MTTTIALAPSEEKIAFWRNRVKECLDRRTHSSRLPAPLKEAIRYASHDQFDEAVAIQAALWLMGISRTPVARAVKIAHDGAIRLKRRKVFLTR